MKKIPQLVALFGASLAVVLGGLSGVASAANSNSASSSNGANGYKVSPVRTDLTVKSGESQNVTVYVQNISNAVENLQTIINDFTANANESGQPVLLLNGKNAPEHGLKQYATVPNGTFTLQPNEQQAVQVKISIPNNATAGGYYGAVRFAPSNTSGDKNVNLSASVASLILVTVPGNLVEKVSLASFQAAQNDHARTFFTGNKNLSAVARFQNSGDVQEQPFGKVQLKKGSKVLATYEINNTDPRGNVLPDSIRKFSVGLDKVGSFGKYTIEGNFGYGSDGQLLSGSTSFYVIPGGVILLVVIVLLLILFLIFVFPRMIRNYNRSVIRRAQRKSRRR